MANEKAKTADGGKAKKIEKATEVAVTESKAVPEPRKPADPRLKYMKKMKGRFLPKGALRDRHKAILVRWSSGEDHGNVTIEELRSLFEDWRTTRATLSRTT